MPFGVVTTRSPRGRPNSPVRTLVGADQLTLLELENGRSRGTGKSVKDAELGGAHRERPKTVVCGWCGAVVPVRTHGRVPTWCSNACRHRAWEQRRAADSGLAAVRVVDRPVEVLRTVTKIEEVRIVVSPSTVEEWLELLATLTERLDRGRIYDRDLGRLLPSMSALFAAFERRCR